MEVREAVIFDTPLARQGSDDGVPPTRQAVVESYTELLGAKGQDHCMVRVYVRDGTPVGGIPVTEHFEVNLVPLNINIKQSFVDAMTAFMFPGEDDAAAAATPAPMVDSPLGDDMLERTYSGTLIRRGGSSSNQAQASTEAERSIQADREGTSPISSSKKPSSSAGGTTVSDTPVAPPRLRRSQLRDIVAAPPTMAKHQSSRSDGTSEILLDAPRVVNRRGSLDGATMPSVGATSDTLPDQGEAAEPEQSRHRRSKSSDLAVSVATTGSGASGESADASSSASPPQVVMRAKKPMARQSGHRRTQSSVEAVRSSRTRPHTMYVISIPSRTLFLSL